LEDKGYTLKFEHANAPLPVIADQAKIAQVLHNLIDNAVKYSGRDKKVRVLVYQTGNNVRVDVIDRGKGIEASRIPYIWDKYYRLDKTSQKVEGTGLGLSIVKNVMTLHRGSAYGVESKPGKGSTFYIQLPKAEPPKAEVQGAGETASR
jgi:signal transduction histidine kinase